MTGCQRLPNNSFCPTCGYRRCMMKEDPRPPVDKHILQGWYSQAISAANGIFYLALDGRVSRRRLLDISETLESLAKRIGRAAGNAD